jgi:hypothetical protein
MIVSTNHRERNTVQHRARQRKRSGLDIRDLQACATPSNH